MTPHTTPRQLAEELILAFHEHYHDDDNYPQLRIEPCCLNFDQDATTVQQTLGEAGIESLFELHKDGWTKATLWPKGAMHYDDIPAWMPRVPTTTP